MLFECLDLWVPLVFMQGELALSSIQRRVDTVFERMLGSGILQPSVASQLSICQQLPVTDFCCCVMANLSSGMCLMLKK